MWTRLVVWASFLLLVSGCAAPDVAIKSTPFGGDRGMRAMSKDRQFDVKGINEGDTVIVAPGSQRAVVASSAVNVQLMESFDRSKQQAEEQAKKDLAVNRKPGAKIELLKGVKNDFGGFSPVIQVEREDEETQAFEVDLFAANRSTEAFRGDLVIYDWIPAELTLVSTSAASKYNDNTGLKRGMASIPLVGLFSMAIAAFQKLDEPVSMQVDELDQIRKYTIKRIVLEPGQIVGFTQKLKYNLPAEEELEELRLDTYSRMTRRPGN